jgi:hypothetical protein
VAVLVQREVNVVDLEEVVLAIEEVAEVVKDKELSEILSLSKKLLINLIYCLIITFII